MGNEKGTALSRMMERALDNLETVVTRLADQQIVQREDVSELRATVNGMAAEMEKLVSEMRTVSSHVETLRDGTVDSVSLKSGVDQCRVSILSLERRVEKLRERLAKVDILLAVMEQATAGHTRNWAQIGVIVIGVMMALISLLMQLIGK